MVGRKTLVNRVTEQIVALSTEQFITPDLTRSLLDGRGKPIATNAEVSGILMYYGLARNTGMTIRLGKTYYTVWEKNAITRANSNGKGNEYGSGGVKA